MNNQLTNGQNKVLGLIERFINEHGYSPTQKELAEILGVNLSTTQGYLIRLKDAGVITYEPGQFRTVRLKT